MSGGRPAALTLPPRGPRAKVLVFLWGGWGRVGSSSIEGPTLLYLPLISLLQMRTCDLKLYLWKDFSHYS